MSSLRVLGQPFINHTTFENGMGGWEFKYWMPNGRNASAKICDEKGYRSPKVLQLYADGGDDDGIFFLETRIPADIEGGINQCNVSWWFTLSELGEINQWPRVVYIGKPKNLANRDTQKEFHYFYGRDGLITCDTCMKWYGHFHREKFDSPLDEVMVCIGWKINWETERRFLLDDIVVFGQ